MSEKVTFNYFYGNEADQYSFYRIPKLLFTSEHFKHLSTISAIAGSGEIYYHFYAFQICFKLSVNPV